MSCSGGIEGDPLLHGFIIVLSGINLKGFVRIPEPDHIIVGQVFHRRHSAEIKDPVAAAFQLGSDAGSIDGIRAGPEDAGNAVDPSHCLVLFFLFLS